MPATMKSEKSVLLDRLAALRARTRVHLAIDGVASMSLAFVTICLVSFGVDRVFRLTWGERAFMLALLLGACGALLWRRIVARVLAGIEANAEEILADDRARSVHAELHKDAGPFDANMQKVWDDFVRRQPGPADLTP